MATIEETLRKLGLAAARGVPQLATGFVDLAALPFTMTGVMKPEQAVGSTAYLTSKGLLPPPQEGLLSETTELVSSAMNPATATKAALAKGGLLAAPFAAGSIKFEHGSKEIGKFLNKFRDKAESLKLPYEYGASNISGSQYITFKTPKADYQIRVSNHGDRHPTQMDAYGERFSIDPESGNSFRDAINWLKERNINLDKKPKKQEAVSEWGNLTEEDKQAMREYFLRRQK